MDVDFNIKFPSCINTTNMRKKIIEEKIEQFIIVNELAQVFCGLKGGYPDFNDDWKTAKPLSNETQFNAIQKGTSYKLEMMSV